LRGKGIREILSGVRLILPPKHQEKRHNLKIEMVDGINFFLAPVAASYPVARKTGIASKN
jgi:hypothetical protein